MKAKGDRASLQRRLDRLRQALEDAEARAEFARYLVPSQAQAAKRELQEAQVELAYAQRALGRKK
ncbi:hypothetical protein [Sinorhizobium fredii]|uniref:hypothetical protein n=1 Tax=Rhizobium fredii TaxID=380 RepID=UPI0004B115F7|nr:hypothetical protein [Sinorhizobium fredii]